MKRIFIFPTIEEAKAFILTEPRDPVFVGGVGMAEIAAATLRAVKAKKPQLVVLAGIAGACDRTLRRGEVVEVVCERIAGIPERYAREYETSGPDLGLPLAAGVTVNRSGDGAAATGGPKSAAEGTGQGTPGSRSRTPDLRQTTGRDTQRTAPNARRRKETRRTRRKGTCRKWRTWKAQPFSPYATRWASRAARYVPCRTTSANPSASGLWRRPSGT